MIPMQTILFFRAPERGSWHEVVEGAARYAREHNWMMMDVPQPIDMRIVSSMLCGFTPDGLLVDTPNRTIPEPVKYFSGIPAVLLDPVHVSSRFPALVHDQRSIAQMAADELMGLGLKHLAYIPYNTRETWSVLRGKAFVEVVRSRGCNCTVFKNGSLGKFLAKLPKPAGVFAANDMMAQRVIMATTAEGLHVPRDIAVIGSDDEPFYCESTSPSISSVRTERKMVGYRFAALLDKMIADRSSVPPVSVYSPVGVTRRGSTRLIHMPDEDVEKALEFIRRNACSGRISVDDVANLMGCPRCIATRRFRKATSRSIVEEIHEVRFQRMCELLRTTQTKISAIVNFCGYSSEAFPKRYFLKRTGYSMRSWRKMQNIIPSLGV